MPTLTPAIASAASARLMHWTCAKDMYVHMDMEMDMDMDMDMGMDMDM